MDDGQGSNVNTLKEWQRSSRKWQFCLVYRKSFVIRPDTITIDSRWKEYSRMWDVWEFNSRLIDSCFSKTEFVVQIMLIINESLLHFIN